MYLTFYCVHTAFPFHKANEIYVVLCDQGFGHNSKYTAIIEISHAIRIDGFYKPFVTQVRLFYCGVNSSNETVHLCMFLQSS